MPTKQEMLDRIYDFITKEGEIMYRCNRVREAWNYGTMTRDDFEEELVYGKIMIGDVLDYFIANIYKIKHYSCDSCGFVDIIEKLIYLREEKRKTIDKQSVECIEYVYNLCE